ncbi:MAG: enolase C-terminal domain-like protein [Bacteroidota bacterium]
MKIAEVKFKKYSLPLKKPFLSSSVNFSCREGFIISLTTNDGIVGLGEAAPLVGVSAESIDTVDAELHIISEILLNCEIEFSIDAIKLPLKDCSAGIRYAFEQALFLIGIQSNHFLVEDFVGTTPVIIENNLLVDLSAATEKDEEIFASARTVKIKAGSSIDDLLFNVSKIPPHIKIRIDANGWWSYDDAVKIIGLLENFNIEYIEQPVKSDGDMLALSRSSNILIVPDESINSFEDARNFLMSSGIKTIVIKPMKIGLLESFDIVRETKRHNKNATISSLFETVIGRIGLYLLAIQFPDHVHGISTSNFFVKDLFDDPFAATENKQSFDLSTLKAFISNSAKMFNSMNNI